MPLCDADMGDLERSVGAFGDFSRVTALWLPPPPATAALAEAAKLLPLSARRMAVALPAAEVRRCSSAAVTSMERRFAARSSLLSRLISFFSTLASMGGTAGTGPLFRRELWLRRLLALLACRNEPSVSCRSSF